MSKNLESPIDGIQLEHEWFNHSNKLYMRAHTHGDGTCFFHSLVLALNACNVVYESSRRPFGIEFRKVLINKEKWEEFVQSLEEDVRPLAPDFENVSKQTTYACDFIYSFVSQMYGINLIIVSASASSPVGIIKKFHSPTCPVVIIAHLSSIEHFEPIIEFSRHNTAPRDLIETTREFFAQFFEDETAEEKEVKATLATDWSCRQKFRDYHVRGVFSIEEPICQKLLQAI
ncbi:MAG: hypothetical protein CMO44_17530 [Verrucomicrobiales bacterium]|nr:hypothetical protein [Verrucomicrobiales bacterium]|tara:strand:- start:1047 stop:1736 length:690 start_codon:yes stop_codon:yes gene_type:complete